MQARTTGKLGMIKAAEYPIHSIAASLGAAELIWRSFIYLVLHAD